MNSIHNVLIQTTAVFIILWTYASLWKHIQRAVFQKCYMPDSQFAIHLRMTATLAFVPPNDVINYFNELSFYLKSVF